jgi:hypothetical protein
MSSWSQGFRTCYSADLQQSGSNALSVRRSERASAIQGTIPVYFVSQKKTDKSFGKKNLEG